MAGGPGLRGRVMAQLALSADTIKTGGAPLLAVFEKRVSGQLPIGF